MTGEAAREAEERGVTGKVRWVRVRAEELPAGLRRFTVATLAQSFPWMDREVVAAAVGGMLRPGGALVHISDLKTQKPTVDGLPYPPVPHAAIEELVRHCLGPVRRAGPRGTAGRDAGR
jgi:hypothetical protein